MLNEIGRLILTADIATATSLLRDYVAATVGFPTIEAEIGKAPGSLQAQFALNARPLADDLAAVIAYLDHLEGNVPEVTRHAA